MSKYFFNRTAMSSVRNCCMFCRFVQADTIFFFFRRGSAFMHQLISANAIIQRVLNDERKQYGLPRLYFWCNPFFICDIPCSVFFFFLFFSFHFISSLFFGFFVLLCVCVCVCVCV